MKKSKIIKELGAKRWALGFVRGGMQSIMEDAMHIGDSKIGDKRLQVDWVKMPDDRWYADPFILEVTEKEILLLVEDYAYAKCKGVISSLHIDRATMEIVSRKVLLDIPTHLSFPAIWRKDGHIYVYPESAKSGKLDMYEYHPKKEELTFVQTICNDVVWDSYITEAFGERLLFTAAHDRNDKIMDIYRWVGKQDRFTHYQEVHSDLPNSRLGGAIFEYRGAYYYPAQDCSKVYGGAIDIKRINYVNGTFECSTVKHLTSPHPKYQLGMHTMNEYKGVVVIDVHGYKYGWIGAVIAELVKFKKRLKK